MYTINNEITSPIKYLKGVGPQLALLLDKKNIHTIEDIIYYFPRTYEDRRKIKYIMDLVHGDSAVVKGKIISFETFFIKTSRKKIFNIKLTDNTGNINLKWYGNYEYIKSKFKEGDMVLVAGTIFFRNIEPEIYHPDIEISEEIKNNSKDKPSSLKNIVPIYSETEGLHQKTIRRLIRNALETKLSFIDEFIPESIITKYNMLGIKEALREIHEPPYNGDFSRFLNSSSRAHLRIIFNEFFLLELIIGLKRLKNIKMSGIEFKPGLYLKNKLIENLPFSLTKAQQTTLSEIERDQSLDRPMNRLLQGDVGSGKTLVAIISALNAIECGYQVALMAPTEILASQHYTTSKNLLDKLGIKTDLLVSGLKKEEKFETLQNIQNGKSQFIIGTHALIQKNVNFNNLGLVIIDEQHRFGVNQRYSLSQKAKNNPDILIMTATPIPRTLCLSLYGDLDVSIIDELPPGRTPVLTKIFYERKRIDLYSIIKERVEKGEQVYIVYPLVEESEKLDLKDAINMEKTLSKDIFSDYTLALLHGKMKASQKEEIMELFKDGKINILITTTVIEVGVDVPNATLMIIEHAERFGLSALHQLRGRVGRGNINSMCILMTDFKKSELASQRLEVMTETNDGFKISEEDLKLRGPGDFLGTKQSGIPEFKLADLVRDQKILYFAKERAGELLKIDPTLTKPEHKFLKELVQKNLKEAFWG